MELILPMAESRSVGTRPGAPSAIRLGATLMQTLPAGSLALLHVVSNSAYLRIMVEACGDLHIILQALQDSMPSMDKALVHSCWMT